MTIDARRTVAFDVLMNQAGNSMTGEIDLGVARLAAIEMPTEWDGKYLSFQVARGSGGVFKDLHWAFGSGNEYVAGQVWTIAEASQHILFPHEQWRSIRYLKIRSGRSESPVNQSAPRTLTLYKVQ